MKKADCRQPALTKKITKKHLFMDYKYRKIFDKKVFFRKIN
jgi:hypothetical protein